MAEQTNADWRVEISEPAETLKIADKEIVTITFKDEGMKNVHPDFGTSIAFKVIREGEDKERVWFINSKNFDLLGQIKSLGKLTGQKIKVRRFGSTKSNTRYTIEK